MTNIDDSQEMDGYLDYKVNNIVATAKLDVKDRLDLIKIARKLPDAEFHRERFPGVIYRQETPRATFLIFSTGKMVLTGLEQIKDAKSAVHKLLKKLKKVGIKSNHIDIEIQNIVASGDLHTYIDLNKAILLMEFAMYEPEVFPGLIYHMKNPRAVFLLFSTGKYVCTGIKENIILENAILKLEREINNMDVSNEQIEEEQYELTFL